MNTFLTTRNWTEVLITGLAVIALSVLQVCADELVLYPMNPDHKSDGKVTGTVNGLDVKFEYQHTYHPEMKGTRDFHANYVRFAGTGPVDVELNVDAEITTAHLRTLGKDIAYDRQGSKFSFTLPGPGSYYLQLPDLNIPNRSTYTVFFFYDDIERYRGYEREFASARDVTEHGVVSDPDRNQTEEIQGLLDEGGRLYFPPGIYRTGQLDFNSDTTLLLAPGAVLKGTDTYNTARYIWIENEENIRIAGLGTIDVNGHTSENIQTKGHGIDMERSRDIVLEDVLFRDSNSWMLHIRACDDVRFDNLKLFSGKDGIDPDGSRDVLITRAVIQSVDDGFAVKSRFPDNSSERVTMRDSIVFSSASALKVGTENYHGRVQDILWDNCDVVDSDRGCILYTRADTGTAPISNVTWRNIRIFNFAWEGNRGGSPFQFHKDSEAEISDILLENIVVHPVTDCSSRGGIEATFRNIVVHEESRISPDGLSFEGVIWPGVESESRPVIFIEPSSRNQNEYFVDDFVMVSVLHPFDKAVSRVELFVDGESAGVRDEGPFAFALEGVEDGIRTLHAEATDVDGISSSTAPIVVRMISGQKPDSSQ